MTRAVAHNAGRLPGGSAVAKPLRLAIWCAAILAVAFPAHGDPEVPLLGAVWPGSWAGLLLIIPVEAVIGVCFIGFGRKQAVKISTYANLISTLLGIPLAYIGLIMVAVLTEHWGEGSNSGLDRLYDVTLGSAGGFEYPDWTAPCARMFLCIPFFFVSVWSEYLLARKMLPKDDRPRALRWSWRANITSYSLIFLALTALLIYSLVAYSPDP